MIKQMNVEVTYRLYMRFDLGDFFNHRLPYRYLETYDTEEEAKDVIEKSLASNPAFKDCLEFKIEKDYKIIEEC